LVKMSLRQDLLKTSHRRHQRGIVIKVLFGIGILGIASAVATLLFYVPSLRASTINISGLDKIDEKELRAEILGALEGIKWLIIPRDHMLFLPKKNIEDILSGKYRFRDFEVKKEFPSTLDISITERKTWAIWCSENGNSCLLLDEGGFAFDKSAALSGGVILSIVDAREDDFLHKNILPPEDFNKISRMTEGIAKIIQSDIVKIYIKKDGETYYLYPKNGFYMIIDAETDIEKSLENLSLALRSGEIKEKSNALEYVDLRFPDKVFYKF